MSNEGGDARFEMPARLPQPSSEICIGECEGKFCCRSLAIPSFSKEACAPCAALGRDGSCALHKEIHAASEEDLGGIPCKGYWCGGAGEATGQIVTLAGHPEWKKLVVLDDFANAAMMFRKEAKNPVHVLFWYIQDILE